MAEPQYRNLTSHLEQGVQVLTITATELRGDELSNTILDDLLAAVSQAAEPLKVVLDFRHVQFLTSLGIAALLKFRRHVRDRNGQLLLCNLQPLLADILFATKLAGAGVSTVIPFAVAPDVPAALAYLSKIAVKK